MTQAPTGVGAFIACPRLSGCEVNYTGLEILESFERARPVAIPIEPGCAIGDVEGVTTPTHTRQDSCVMAPTVERRVQNIALSFAEADQKIGNASVNWFTQVG